MLPLLLDGRKPDGNLFEEITDRLGLKAFLDLLPGQLSGGQQQRVAVARAIAARPPVILADEPTGNLDPASGKAVMEILNRLHREGRTLVLITHDMALAATAQRRVHIREGHLRREEEHEFPFGGEGKFGGFRPPLAIDNPPADDIISP